MTKKVLIKIKIKFHWKKILINMMILKKKTVSKKEIQKFQIVIKILQILINILLTVMIFISKKIIKIMRN